MHHNGKQHALFRETRVTEQHFAQFQMAATADGKEFRQPLNDAKNNCFKITHLISLIAVGWPALFFRSFGQNKYLGFRCYSAVHYSGMYSQWRSVG